MKKYILMAFVAATMLLASCKNQDVKVSRIVDFKINPYEVISGFDYEVNAGELESFNSDYKLRINLLVYDDLGYLAASDVQYLTNYQSIMNSSVELPDGSYTAVAISDVVQYDGGVTFNYWDISGTDRLANLKVSDAGYIGGRYKILGISDYQFIVKEGSVDHTMKLKPAGALILMYTRNVHYFTDIVRYQLDMNKTSDFCTFNSDGSYEISIENHGGDFDWRLCYVDPKDHTNFNNVYGYYFVLPLGRTAFKWFAKDSSDTWYYVGDEMSVNIKFGEEYLAYLELGSNPIVSMELVNGGKSVFSPMDVMLEKRCLSNKISQVENPQPLKK